jgi:hypothetical protein
VSLTIREAGNSFKVSLFASSLLSKSMKVLSNREQKSVFYPQPFIFLHRAFSILIHYFIFFHQACLKMREHSMLLMKKFLLKVSTLSFYRATLHLEGGMLSF